MPGHSAAHAIARRTHKKRRHEKEERDNDTAVAVAVAFLRVLDFCVLSSSILSL
jgi:hypothetical protein